MIGGGSGGLNLAIGAAGLKAKVALIENSMLGGRELLGGNVPLRVLTNSAKAMHDMKFASRQGLRDVRPEELKVHFEEIMQRARDVRAKIARLKSAHLCSEFYGIDLFFGEPLFVKDNGEDAIFIAGTTLKFSKAVVAVGCHTELPKDLGRLEAPYYVPETLLNMEQ